MTNSSTPSEIWRSSTPSGPRYYVRATHPAQAHRLFPIGRDAAELAIAQGATVYAKLQGEHWMLAEKIS